MLDPVWWVIDGNNVMGAGADGWWRDRTGAAARLTERIAGWAAMNDGSVTVVFDGAPADQVAALARPGLTVEFAARRGRDAADDRIVALAEAARDAAIVVVTSDRGLIARLPASVEHEGVADFRARIGLATGRTARTGRRH